MTTPREGSRVKVVIPEANVEEDGDGYVHISYDDIYGEMEVAKYVPAGWCEVISDPLKVGDKLGANSPEPPPGTIVSTDPMDGRRVTWTRNASDENYRWVPSHSYTPDSWIDFVSKELPRIEYVPEVVA